jgi:hypothetical protein
LGDRHLDERNGPLKNILTHHYMEDLLNKQDPSEYSFLSKVH